MNKRLTIFSSSVVIAIIAVWMFTQITWSPSLAYGAYIVLALFFLGVLVSNQQYEEDNFSKIERVASAFLLSYIVFFRLLYAPLSQFFFGNISAKDSFFVDLLVLVFFVFFFFLFGTAFLVLNKYSEVGFLSHWRFFNNEKAFFVLRGLLLAAIFVFLLFYLRNSFFSIKKSVPINAVLPAATCNWTYIKYPNFLSMEQAKTGRDVCLYNLAQDKYDPKYCELIDDSDTKDLCRQYFVAQSEK